MAVLELSTDQVIQLVKQLPAPDRRAVLDALAVDREAWWRSEAERGEQDMRRIAAARGLTWETMSDEEREEFIDNLLHEAA